MTSGEKSPERPMELGGHSLVRAIGQGGMGVVYLARRRAEFGSRLVALKRIRSEFPQRADLRNMFFDEVQLAAQIHHPNVVSLYECGVDKGIAWYTMTPVLGFSLSELIHFVHHEELSTRASAFFPYLLVRCLIGACEGLHAAHELSGESGEPLGVVHRDICPQNILVGADGASRVADFGIAYRIKRLHETATNQVKGRHSYVSPERLRKERIDRRADVWALGAVLFEGLTGELLFPQKDLLSLATAIESGPLPSIRERRPDLPSELDEIVGKALARDPAYRYPTARAMGSALAELLYEERVRCEAAEVARWIEEVLGDTLRKRRSLMRGG